ncbi:MAG: 1-(5-phosphoribosyl)-5-[(5-phosphoribosylamino)methylideneamino]imidazole-4-carboxamide isomerase [Verrucomicrobia bacterium]|nr:1-(5-phosphoribosyl)-5-[(5-phosphoribosylamino)methylideneamino]imidazole-4-carboxamide isomerase [Verrucomicrobiota bacterium]
MLILPAIDLKGGKVVRLRQGRADDATTYSDDPAAVARQWEREGARYLHVVDLDAAFEGEPKNWPALQQILESVRIPIELGGGLRTEEHIARALELGVTRAIVGTKACESLDFVAALVKRHGERIVVGVDAKDGVVAVRGWVAASTLRAVDFAKQIAAIGVKTIVYTDIAKDGMLQGPNFAAMAEMADALAGTPTGVIASGGISCADDVRRLRALGKPNLVGVIIGKALYDGRLALREVLV